MVEDHTVTMTGTFVGTPHYMSPEQVDDQYGKLDHRSDIYSLGATLYELLTLQQMYKGNGTREELLVKILTKSPTRPGIINPDVPLDLETICLKAIEKNPKDRYQTAQALADDLGRFVTRHAIQARRSGPIYKGVKFVRRHKLLTTLIVMVGILGVVAGIVGYKNAQTKWVNEIAIPAIVSHIESEDFFDAYRMAKQVEAVAPNHIKLYELWPLFSRKLKISTTPEDAYVTFSNFEHPEQAVISLGHGPFTVAHIPFGMVYWHLYKDGYRSIEGVRRNDQIVAQTQDDKVQSVIFKLFPIDECPADMIKIPGDELPKYHSSNKERIVISDYLIDKFEVTNNAFKIFVDNGGYRNEAYWHFKHGEDTLLTTEIRNTFIDQSGNQGPATWRNSTFPVGEGNHPVSGVSWFEAAAYAKFVGKHLPTIYHWLHAASLKDVAFGTINTLSNFTQTSVEVGAYKGMSRFGLRDMTGNVREWCFNAINDSDIKVRSILGGGFGDHYYIYNYKSVAFDQLNRDQANGFRLMKYINPKDLLSDRLLAPQYKGVKGERREFKPLPRGEVEAIISTLYAYDNLPFNLKSDNVIETEDAVRERVTIDTNYGDDRLVIYLHLPKNAKPPYQPIVWFPGSFALQSTYDDYFQGSTTMHAILSSGRAVIAPVYLGHWERIIKQKYKQGSVKGRDYHIKITQDMMRAIDYLETRDDIDIDYLGYVGLSHGAIHGPRMMGVDSRFGAGVWLGGGVSSEVAWHPAAYPLNFAPLIDAPVLMINGYRDSIFPYETTQKPLFNAIGATVKDHLVLEGGHSVAWKFKDKYNNTMNEWFDLHLGPVVFKE